MLRYSVFGEKDILLDRFQPSQVRSGLTRVVSPSSHFLPLSFCVSPLFFFLFLQVPPPPPPLVLPHVLSPDREDCRRDNAVRP